MATVPWTRLRLLVGTAMTDARSATRRPCLRKVLPVTRDHVEFHFSHHPDTQDKQAIHAYADVLVRL